MTKKVDKRQQCKRYLPSLFIFRSWYYIGLIFMDGIVLLVIIVDIDISPAVLQVCVQPIFYVPAGSHDLCYAKLDR